MTTERVPSGGIALAPPTAELRTQRRTDALFKSLSTDYLLREQFVTDPAQVLAEYVSGDSLPEETADVANQLVYAVVAHPRLRSWLLGYGARQAGRMPTRQEIADELAKAVAASGDHLVARALMRSGAERDAGFVLQADMLRALVGVLGGQRGASGTEMSPGTATEMSPGTATEMSPGAIFTGTEMSPGTATEMSPGAIFGTEMSPGTATEMSPGGFGGVEVTLPSHIRVTLGALVEHATQLRSSGALHFTGLDVG